MKKLCAVVALACLLAGCAGEETLETIADEAVVSRGAARDIRVELPEETVLPVMQTDTGELYICRDFEVSVQTLPGGDLGATVKTLTGFSPEDVTVAELEDRWELVWTCAGETGTEVGRAVILADGGYHYCLSVLTAEENALQYREMFNGMFESFALD